MIGIDSSHLEAKYGRVWVDGGLGEPWGPAQNYPTITKSERSGFETVQLSPDPRLRDQWNARDCATILKSELSRSLARWKLCLGPLGSTSTKFCKLWTTNRCKWNTFCKPFEVYLVPVQIGFQSRSQVAKRIQFGSLFGTVCKDLGYILHIFWNFGGMHLRVVGIALLKDCSSSDLGVARSRPRAAWLKTAGS